jgi:hypothetical protein
MWLRNEGRGCTVVLGVVATWGGAGAGGYIGRASPCSAVRSGSRSSLIGVDAPKPGGSGNAGAVVGGVMTTSSGAWCWYISMASRISDIKSSPYRNPGAKREILARPSVKTEKVVC